MRPPRPPAPRQPHCAATWLPRAHTQPRCRGGCAGAGWKHSTGVRAEFGCAPLVQDEAFWEGSQPVVFGELPQLQASNARALCACRRACGADCVPPAIAAAAGKDRGWAIPWARAAQLAAHSTRPAAPRRTP
jgi:hypothetical protein